MKTILVLILSIIAGTATAQTGASFEEIKAAGVSISHLDSTYKSAIHTDKKLAAFPGREEQVQKAYIAMLTDLATFLKKHDFKWAETVHCFNRVYFNSDGRIDYFLYNFRGSITPEKQAGFKQLLNEFIATYQFGMKNKVKFVQCSPVTYQD